MRTGEGALAFEAARASAGHRHPTSAGRLKGVSTAAQLEAASNFVSQPSQRLTVSVFLKDILPLENSRLLPPQLSTHRETTRKMAPANSLPAWADLQAHHDSVGNAFVLKEAFKSDPERFSKFSRTFKLPAAVSSDSVDSEILFDFSKNLVTVETLDKLVKLAEGAGLEKKRDDMFDGKKINFTEDRAVYHVALRNVESTPMSIDGVDVVNTPGGVNDVLEHIRVFTEQVRSGEWKGFTGKRLTTIVNIGIGGSDL